MNELPTEPLRVKIGQLDLESATGISRIDLANAIRMNEPVMVETPSGQLSLNRVEVIAPGVIRASLERLELRPLIRDRLISGQERDFYLKTSNGKELHLEANSPSFKAEALKHAWR